MPAIIVLSGSTRSDSFNARLAAEFAILAANEGADVRHLSLADYPMPIYDGDLETDKGLPDGARALREQLTNAAGMIIACPEYNGFMTPLLINAIDWCTRGDNASGDLSPFAGKIALLGSCSPGPGGGARAAVHLKTMLSGIGVFVMPQTMAVGSAHKAFDASGKLTDEGHQKRAAQLVKKFCEVCTKLQ